MAWLNNVFNFLAGGQYEQSPAPLTSGATGPLLVDRYKRLIVVAAPPGSTISTGENNWYVSNSAGEYQGAVKTTPGTFFWMYGFNRGASDRFLMLFNLSSVPSDGTAPWMTPIPIISLQPFSFEMPRGRNFSTGLVWAVSTTGDTLTKDTGATVHLTTEYL